MKGISLFVVALLLATNASAGFIHRGPAIGDLRKWAPSTIDDGVPDIGPARIVPTNLPTMPQGLLQQISTEFSSLYRKSAPSVVLIEISGDDRTVRDIEHRKLDETLDAQLGPDSKEATVFNLMPKPDHKLGNGSGFIVDPSGIIVTNDHVVTYAAQGAKLTVKLLDGTRTRATVLEVSPEKDFALIKADFGARQLPTLKLSDSNKASVGEIVCALGNPLGLESVFTCGSIVALNKKMGIQTDAAINPGNSGGPLLNASGEVVGIVQMVITNETGAIRPCTGFAIPINEIKLRLSKLSKL